jgi:hypothetical protein
LHQDPTGFQVAAPSGWAVSREGTMVYFREPDGRVLGIDQTDQPKWDPVADWTAQEKQRSGTLVGYQRIRIESVAFFLTGADWEYTYLWSDGTRLHVLDRGFVTSSTRAYAIFWLTPESQWEPSLPTFQLIAASFRPAP